MEVRGQLNASATLRPLQKVRNGPTEGNDSA